jgi:hypothetical protein
VSQSTARRRLAAAPSKRTFLIIALDLEEEEAPKTGVPSGLLEIPCLK